MVKIQSSEVGLHYLFAYFCVTAKAISRSISYMSKPKCDIHANNKRCAKLVYAEVYWKKGGWSYVCKSHFVKKRKHYRGYGILDEWWISDQFMIALRKIENRFGICQKNGKTPGWCLAVEFNDELQKLVNKVFKSVEKRKAK